MSEFREAPLLPTLLPAADPVSEVLAVNSWTGARLRECRIRVVFFIVGIRSDARTPQSAFP